MIIAYTSFDCVARVLGGAAIIWSEEIEHLAPRWLRPPRDSVSGCVCAALKDNSDPLVFWGHGTAKGLVGQDREHFPCDGSHDLLANRLIIGVCCHSCDDLAERAKARQGTVLGFHGQLAVPFWDPYRFLVQDCLLSGIRALGEGASVAVAKKKWRTAFRTVARGLHTTMQMPDMINAADFNANYKAADFVGDENRRLVPSAGGGPTLMAAARAEPPAPEEAKNMDKQTIDELVQKLKAWVEQLPNPRAPIIGFANNNDDVLSPEQILGHIQNVQQGKPDAIGERYLRNWAELMEEDDAE
jgi:hypothetical protein